MRLFVGVALAEAVRDELGAVVGRLKSKQDGLRWTEPESWHVTLQFLGSTDAEAYKCVAARLGEVRAGAVPVELDGVGCFERAGIFYAGVKVTAELVALQQRVVAATRQCGFVPESRPYSPHITLARSKGRGRGEELGQLAKRMQHKPVFSGFVAGEFLIYESFLLPSGSRYEIRERFGLRGG